MEYIIVKNGHIFGRATDPDWTGDDQISLATVEYIPPFPEDDPGKGKFWDLDYVDDVLTWVQKDRPLTTDERIAEMEEQISQTAKAWKVGEWVDVGDERYHMGTWYKCIQAHRTQADWAPDLVPALWQILLR